MIQIKSRWTLDVIYTSEKETLKEAVVEAVEKRAYLSGADLREADLREADLREADLSRADLSGADLREAYLRGADLSRADLREADLSGAYLSGADLREADLREADLSRADLSRADLSGADLRGAYLRGAYLRGAYLREADLSGADLSGADLSGADLSGADLREADLSEIKNDFWEILMHAPAEIAGLRAALVEGCINGSTYQGDCACLVGTIANCRHVNYEQVTGIAPDSDRPAERWFLGIKVGDTPETNQISKIALDWLDELVSLASMFSAVKTETK